MFTDLTFAVRTIRRSPLFYGGAAVILALGIGLAAATFSVFYSVLLRPLPVVDEGRLVLLVGEMPGAHSQILPVSRRMLRDFARQTRTLSAVSGVAFDGPWRWLVRDAHDATQSVSLHASVVPGNFFTVLGTKASLGRTLLPQDDELGAPRVAVISHELWLRDYGADARVIGSQLVDQTSNAAYTIVGVTPPGLAFERGTDVWRPLNAQFPVRADSDLDNIYAMLRVVARLAPGATLGAARGEFAAFLRAAMSQRNASLARKLGAVARPLSDEVVGDVRPALRIIAAAVALLLLIACLNVANLMLMRGVSRTSEFAVRTSLGASRGRLVRQLLTEGIVLAVIAAALGIVIAEGALRVVVSLAPPEVARLAAVHLDATMLYTVIAVAVVAVLLFALGPALAASSKDLQNGLRSGSRSVTSSRHARTRRQSLVVAQVALTVVVLASAGLLGQTLAHLEHLALGFDAQRLDVIEVRGRHAGEETPTAVNDLMDRLVERARHVPNVDNVAAAIETPFSNGGISGFVSSEDESPAQHASDPFSDLEFVTPSYFPALGTRVLRGRVFDETDARSASPVVVISESVARHYWPGQDALGKRLHCLGDDELCPVIGVVEDTHYRDLVRPNLTVYRPSRQAPAAVFAPRVLLVRTTTDPASVLPLLRSALVAGDSSLRFGRTTPVADLLAAPLAQPRLNAMLVTVFAVSALILACAGIFGLLAFQVALRTREMGIRQALGATPRELATMLVREGMAMQGTGVLCGIAVSLLMTRLMRSLLFDVAPSDPVALLGASALLLVCGMLSVAVPARRAARVEPSAALRAE